METDTWCQLYKERYLLESNWKNDKFTKHELSRQSLETFCIKSYKHWIITGSKDCTKFWNNENFRLRILGKPSPEDSDLNLSEYEFQELMEESDDMTHLRDVLALDINDKYLASCSLDGSFIS